MKIINKIAVFVICMTFAVSNAAAQDANFVEILRSFAIRAEQHAQLNDRAHMDKGLLYGNTVELGVDAVASSVYVADWYNFRHPELIDIVFWEHQIYSGDARTDALDTAWLLLHNIHPLNDMTIRNDGAQNGIDFFDEDFLGLPPFDGNSMYVNSLQTITVPASAVLGDVVVNSGGTLVLSDCGTYQFNSLILNSDAVLQIRGEECGLPTEIYINGDTPWSTWGKDTYIRGEIVAEDGQGNSEILNPSKFIIGSLGQYPHRIGIEKDFEGTIIAPHGDVVVSCNKQYVGAIYADNVTIHQDAEVIPVTGAWCEYFSDVCINAPSVLTNATILPMLSQAGFDFSAEELAEGLELMTSTGVVYQDGLDEAEKSIINKMLTDMVNAGKIDEAMAKKEEELADFLAQQTERGGAGSEPGSDTTREETAVNIYEEGKELEEDTSVSSTTTDEVYEYLDLLDANGIDYSDGLSETDKSMINKMLTEMTNAGKIDEALAIRDQELSDFLARQTMRSGEVTEPDSTFTETAIDIYDMTIEEGFAFDIYDIAEGFELLKANGINYENGLSETDKSMINKMLTDMTNSGKISEALAKKISELTDFLVQQTTR